MATVCLTPLQQVLEERFKQMAGCQPEWARPYPAPIPLVGRNYIPGRGLMVYASAENLTWMDRDQQHGDPRWASFRADTARVRCQHQYQNPQLQVDRLQVKRFFPDVGMAPVSNGGLLCAAWLVLHHCHGTAPSSPAELLRSIAVANWCKYVMRGRKAAGSGQRSSRNLDYVRDADKLRESLPYVRIELDVLRPRLVIMPKAICQHPDIYEAMRCASPETTFVGVMQFNATVVNTRLNQPRFDDAAAELRSRYASTPLATWMGELTRVKPDHAWRFLAHLENELRAARGSSSTR